MKPYLGQIVLFHSDVAGACCVPAVIIKTGEDPARVDLSLIAGSNRGLEYTDVEINLGPEDDLRVSWSPTEPDIATETHRVRMARAVTDGATRGGV